MNRWRPLMWNDEEKKIASYVMVSVKREIPTEFIFSIKPRKKNSRWEITFWLGSMCTVCNVQQNRIYLHWLVISGGVVCYNRLFQFYSPLIFVMLLHRQDTALPFFVFLYWHDENGLATRFEVHCILKIFFFSFSALATASVAIISDIQTIVVRLSWTQIVAQQKRAREAKKITRRKKST